MANYKATTKYKKGNYDRVSVDFPKGEREIIHDHAKRIGMTYQQFIRRAVYNTIEQDRKELMTTWDYSAGAVTLPGTNKVVLASNEDEFREIQYRMPKGSLLTYEEWEDRFMDSLEAANHSDEPEDGEYEYDPADHFDGEMHPVGVLSD
ncbi:MAG: hypothetical protein K6C12_11270 [Oscillospiraceae bacterium]|nr:hypothetical protein [Oscillospiraceae bacterium]